MRARGGDLTAKSIPSVGGLIEHFCSGVGTFDFFDKETGTKIKRGYNGIFFLGFGKSSCLLKSSVKDS